MGEQGARVSAGAGKSAAFLRARRPEQKQLKYFGTRAEIFLRLAEAEWLDWADAAVARLATVTGADEMAGVLARSLAERPLLCQLLTHASLTLERNVSPHALRRSKAAAVRSTDVVAEAIHRLLPDLDRQSCLELVGATALIAAGLWQAANPPPAVRARYAEQSSPASFGRPAALDMTAELSRFVRVFRAGLGSVPARPHPESGKDMRPG